MSVKALPAKVPGAVVAKPATVPFETIDTGGDCVGVTIRDHEGTFIEIIPDGNDYQLAAPGGGEVIINDASGNLIVNQACGTTYTYPKYEGELTLGSNAGLQQIVHSINTLTPDVHFFDKTTGVEVELQVAVIDQDTIEVAANGIDKLYTYTIGL